MSQASQVFTLYQILLTLQLIIQYFLLTKQDAEVEIEIWSISGKKIYSEDLGRSAGMINYRINFSEKAEVMIIHFPD